MTNSAFRHIAILVIVLAVFIAAGQQLIPSVMYQHIWIIFGFLVLLSIISMTLIKKLYDDYPDIFLNLYLGIVVGRLFIMMIFAGLFVYYDKPHALHFTVSFLILYLLFHGFEIKGIISNLRHQIKKGNNNDRKPEKQII